MTERRLFALDQGFPQSIVGALRASIRECELVWVGDIHKKLGNVDDWEVLLALHGDTRRWDGLITTDHNMLNLPKAMTVLHQTGLSLVAVKSAGHDPLLATGLLLANLPLICRDTEPNKGQVWLLQARTPNIQSPMKLLNRIANHQNSNGGALFKAERLSAAQLKGNLIEEWERQPDLELDD